MKWVKVLADAELAEGERRVMDVQGRSIALIRHGGELFALGAKCPHLGGPLHKGKISDGHIIECPWHHSKFDMRTGEVIAWSTWPPVANVVLGAISPEKRLTVYPTRVQDGQIEVGIEE